MEGPLWHPAKPSAGTHNSVVDRCAAVHASRPRSRHEKSKLFGAKNLPRRVTAARAGRSGVAGAGGKAPRASKATGSTAVASCEHHLMASSIRCAPFVLIIRVMSPRLRAMAAPTGGGAHPVSYNDQGRDSRDRNPNGQGGGD